MSELFIAFTSGVLVTISLIPSVKSPLRNLGLGNPTTRNVFFITGIILPFVSVGWFGEASSHDTNANQIMYGVTHAALFLGGFAIGLAIMSPPAGDSGVSMLVIVAFTALGAAILIILALVLTVPESQGTSPSCPPTARVN